MVSPISIGCSECLAAAGEHCHDDGDNRPEGPHLIRITTALAQSRATQQEGSTVTSTNKIDATPSTPVAAPAVDVPLDEGAALANPDAYNGPIEDAAHEEIDIPTDSPTSPDLPITGTNAAEMDEADKKKAIGEVYSQTTTWLREKYRDEFHEHMRTMLAERGIDWKPSPTKAERAKAKARQTLIDAGLPVPADLA